MRRKKGVGGRESGEGRKERGWESEKREWGRVREGRYREIEVERKW